MTSITFVTALMNIYNKSVDDKQTEIMYCNFEKIANSGINICLYSDNYYYQKLSEIIIPYPNVKLMSVFNLEDTFFYKTCKKFDYSLPNNRNIEKDTDNFMIFQNSKIEFISQAMKENPWNSTHFAWIDFNIASFIKKMIHCYDYFTYLSKKKLSGSFLTFPGCWKITDKDSEYFMESMFNNINWRFCGSFFIGDTKSIFSFFELSKIYFEIFMKEHKKLIWEVNFWAWLEKEYLIQPKWYNSDHNDKIITELIQESEFL
jgi:hypothetical protein